jgi:hypothetical protein
VSSISNTNGAAKNRFWRLRIRPRLLVGFAVLAAFGYIGHLLWQHYAASISRHPQYLISPESIVISTPPPWIRSNIRTEVLRDAGLVGSLSVLDVNGQLHDRIQSAFEFHPWVQSVDRITKHLPAALEISLTYRRPLAAVEVAGDSGPAGWELLPADPEAVRLPEADFTDAELRHLPRIVGRFDRPLIGQPWQDPRVSAGVALVAKLEPLWHRLHLAEIVPADRPAPEFGGEIALEIVTSGGTRVLWGAAPGREPEGESSFAIKLERLESYATSHGKLDSINGPESLDIRRDLIVVPRTAKRSDAPLVESAGRGKQQSPEVATRPNQDSRQ